MAVKIKFTSCSSILAAWGYLGLGTAFAVVPLDYQWILGIILPLVREFFVWNLTAVSNRAAGEQSRNSYTLRFTCSHYMETRHAIFLAIMMGNAADTTVYTTLGIDFVLNIYHGMQIIYKKINAVTPEAIKEVNGKYWNKMLRIPAKYRVSKIKSVKSKRL